MIVFVQVVHHWSPESKTLLDKYGCILAFVLSSAMALW